MALTEQQLDACLEIPDLRQVPALVAAVRAAWVERDALHKVLEDAVELADYYASGGSPDSCGFAAELRVLVCANVSTQETNDG